MELSVITIEFVKPDKRYCTKQKIIIDNKKLPYMLKYMRYYSQKLPFANSLSASKIPWLPICSFTFNTLNRIDRRRSSALSYPYIVTFPYTCHLYPAIDTELLLLDSGKTWHILQLQNFGISPIFTHSIRNNFCLIDIFT